MITCQCIEDHQLIERYLADQPGDRERAEFEAFYLRNPDVLQDMQAAAGLELGLQQLVASTTGNLPVIDAVPAR